jgi:RimJ/RimL family protein N-acetyltransferase
MWGDPVVTRHISGKPLTPEEVWGRILRYTGHWALLGFGYWLVEEKDSGAFAGEIGFADNKRDLGLDSLLRDLPEIGWVFSPRVHGRGYATEAVRAATHWVDTHFAGGPTGCIIGPENAASLRVAEKCGYSERQRLSYKGHTAIVLIR